MKLSSKWVRLLFVAAFVLMGLWGGSALAAYYFSWLDQVIGTKDPRFVLWSVNPRPLSNAESYVLHGVFLLVGVLLGIVGEHITYRQATKARIKFDSMAPHDKMALVAGLVLGLILTALLQNILNTSLRANIIIAVVLCYATVVAMLSIKEQFKFYLNPGSRPVTSARDNQSVPKLLDTNVIIDGRIADICKAGFVEGTIYVPRFVLEELQQIADSGDPLKRARGRRGLEILNQMQNDMDLQVPEFAVDDATEVDAMLVIVARQIGGAIITNDFNLNSVAKLQGVTVLNINELANAVKPVVLPGEEMRVTIIKEGKEKDQGVAYLDDGTMIVVEGGRRLIDSTLDVSVTSVLQTVQGKMIFARVKENAEGSTARVENGIGTYPGGRERRKIR